MTKPLPRHKLSEADASFELARLIADWLDGSSLFPEWSVGDEGVPGHFIKFKGDIYFVIFPRLLTPVARPIKTPLDHFHKATAMMFPGPAPHGLLPSSPDFFEKLGEKMMEIQGRDQDQLWRPK